MKALLQINEHSNLLADMRTSCAHVYIATNITSCIDAPNKYSTFQLLLILLPDVRAQVDHLCKVTVSAVAAQRFQHRDIDNIMEA